MHAAPLEFQLENHGKGTAKERDFGLLLEAVKPPGRTMSVLSAVLTFDPDNLGAGASITGQLQSNNDGSIWDVTWSFTGLVATGGGFRATDAVGSIALVGDSTVINFVGKQNAWGNTFVFKPDGHRLDGDNTTWVARGWYMLESGHPAGTTNDWLVQASVIPLPGALLLFGTALSALIFVRRRRTALA